MRNTVTSRRRQRVTDRDRMRRAAGVSKRIHGLPLLPMTGRSRTHSDDRQHEDDSGEQAVTQHRAPGEWVRAASVAGVIMVGVRVIGDSSEDEMVACFLLGELTSRRFGVGIRRALAAAGESERLLTDADLVGFQNSGRPVAYAPTRPVRTR